MNSEQSTEQVLPGQIVEGGQLVTHAQRRFYASGLCQDARRRLQALVDSPEYATDPSPHIVDPVPFVERHLKHLSMYPNTNLDGYISNLKLMTNSQHAKPAN
jgi:hypothetical protein